MHPQGLEQIADAIDHMYAGKNTVNASSFRGRRLGAAFLMEHGQGPSQKLL
jgi:hypothetical protein